MHHVEQATELCGAPPGCVLRALECFLLLPLGPDIICRWWTSAITMAISWLQGDDAAVRVHFTEVEHVPKALEVTEYVRLLGYSPASLQEDLVRVSGRERFRAATVS